MALHQPANCGKRARHKLITFSIYCTSHGLLEKLEIPLVEGPGRVWLLAILEKLPRGIIIMYICICYNYYYAFLFIILCMFKKTELMLMRTGIWASIDRLKQTAHHTKQSKKVTVRRDWNDAGNRTATSVLEKRLTRETQGGVSATRGTGKEDKLNVLRQRKEEMEDWKGIDNEVGNGVHRFRVSKGKACYRVRERI